ncbi:MAG: hypothetical protein DMG41_18715 [Acidobacteria bacterium]|nr:MAG: hypothetical protein AUH13_02380 [Acidobacteria bacterium 13_2_20CM_58_27]PYT86732.1 MAG: hypothetical protein DMG41_18715 [Acidobacteriota bacterium]
MPNAKKIESAEEPLERGQARQANARPLIAAPTGLRLRLLFWCLAIALGALEVWARRNEVNPDSISYIEMAEAAAQGGWHALVNAYWSPLYPLLLSVGMRLFHPAIYWEFTFVHMVNFLLYLGDLFCFEIFLKELLAARRTEGGLEKGRPVPERIVWIWGYLLLLWSSQFWLGLAMVNPDIIVAGLIYVATALLLRIYQGKGTWLLFSALGLVLGLAYLAKAAMFPLSFLFLASAFLLFASKRGSYLGGQPRSAFALAVFLSLASPLVIALSKDKHRATFGDAGRLNYARYVGGAPILHWQGEPPGTGSPAHPTRKVLANPPIYEFAQPIAGSYPPWYDPSYWYEGIRPHFSWNRQLWVLFRSANLYLKLFSRSGALYVVLLALIVQVGKAGGWDWGGGRMSLVWLPTLAALTMYALVLVEQRYVSPFAVMLLVWVLTSARFSASKAETVRKRTAPAVILALALAMAWPVARDLRDTLANRPDEPWQVAVGLHKMKISPGARVGAIGTGPSAYWAHLARVQIIAEVSELDQLSFLVAGPARKEEALRKFSELGAKAVVMKSSSAPQAIDGWQEVGGTHYYVWRPAGH